MKKYFCLILILLSIICKSQESNHLISEGKTIGKRFSLPLDYIRNPESSNSFGHYLRNLPLKYPGSLVSFFDGQKKPNNNIYDAVIDLPIGKKDLHQNAQAIIRLKADYLYKQKLYNQIRFNFTNGFRADYASWRLGKKITLKEGVASWVAGGKPVIDNSGYWNYLETVFENTNINSLDKDLKSIDIDQIKIGDIFIKGGDNGHAVIVVDVAINVASKKKIFLLAQSYAPAQELQILKNPENQIISTWYKFTYNKLIETPECTFCDAVLKRF